MAHEIEGHFGPTGADFTNSLNLDFQFNSRAPMRVVIANTLVTFSLLAGGGGPGIKTQSACEQLNGSSGPFQYSEIAHDLGKEGDLGVVYYRLIDRGTTGDWDVFVYDTKDVAGYYYVEQPDGTKLYYCIDTEN